MNKKLRPLTPNEEKQIDRILSGRPEPEMQYKPRHKTQLMWYLPCELEAVLKEHDLLLMMKNHTIGPHIWRVVEIDETDLYLDTFGQDLNEVVAWANVNIRLALIEVRPLYIVNTLAGPVVMEV